MTITYEGLMAQMRSVMAAAPLGAPRIQESWLMVDRVEDWSRVRSPSRAIRRMKKGYRQNIDIIETPKKEAISLDGGRTLIMHPVMAAKLRRVTETPK